MYRSLCLYSLALIVVVAWWGIAFYSTTDTLIFPIENQNHSEAPSRQLLRKALAGDINTMVTLLQTWDHEAEQWQEQGIDGIKRLSGDDYAHAMQLAHELHTCQWTTSHHLFPQTHVAATMLLAMVPPEACVAIPQGMRNGHALFSHEFLETISTDAEQCIGEKITTFPIDLALVARYSSPSILQTLRTHHIPMLQLDEITTIEGIQHTIQHLATAIDRPAHGELMALFVDAALIALDNEWHSHRALCAYPQRSILYLNHFAHLSVPGRDSLTGQLLRRMGVSLEGAVESRRELDQEQIWTLQPDGIVLAMRQGKYAVEHLKRSPAFSFLSGRHRIAVIDEGIQESPTQEVALAYYDLMHAMIGVMDDKFSHIVALPMLSGSSDDIGVGGNSMVARMGGNSSAVARGLQFVEPAAR